MARKKSLKALLNTLELLDLNDYSVEDIKAFRRTLTTLSVQASKAERYAQFNEELAALKKKYGITDLGDAEAVDEAVKEVSKTEEVTNE